MTKASRRTELRDLETLALSQGGYFDRQDARAHNVGDDLLHYYVATGRFERIFPGIYRLTTAPMSPHDELLLAWVWSNYRGAISHESALALYDLSDLMPTRIHLTVPLNFGRSSGPFALHRSKLKEEDVTTHEGVRVTTPARSIVDAASSGADPEQIRKAAMQALDRALTSPEKLRAAARRRGYRHRRTVQPLLEAAIDDATTAARRDSGRI